MHTYSITEIPPPTLNDVCFINDEARNLFVFVESCKDLIHCIALTKLFRSDITDVRFLMTTKAAHDIPPTGPM